MCKFLNSFEWRSAIVAAAIFLSGTSALHPVALRAQEKPGFNQHGNILIADQFNNRVIEINRHHQVVWHFGDGSSVAGLTSVVGTNDAQRVGELTLISGTGTPPNADPSCADNVNGCPDNRVMLVDKSGKIVWQYGQAGVTGSGLDQLNTPVQATFLSNRNILITDQGNQRVIEVTPDKKIVWQYGMTGVIGSGFNQLSNPNSAELLQNGHVLIADENNNRVIEVTRGLKIVWQFPNPVNTALLNGAAFASRLPNGNTLITDSNNNRIIEVTQGGSVGFTYATNARPGSIANPLPTRAVRLHNGNTLISDQFNDQVIEINPAGESVFTYGRINREGKGYNEVNAPYDAKVIEDYTGLTAPSSDGDQADDNNEETE